MRFTIDTTLIGNPEGSRLLEAGEYYGIIRNLKPETFPGGYKGHPNPNDPNGKWDYLKVVPELEVKVGNDEIVTIDRQGLIMGVFHNGGLYRPDGRTDLSPLFTSPGSAYYFFRQLGLLEQENFDFAPSLFENAAVKVNTFYSGFVRRGWDFKPEELLKEFQLMSGEENRTSWPVADIEAMVLYWNVQSAFAVLEQPDQGPTMSTLEVCRAALDPNQPEYSFEYVPTLGEERDDRLRVYNHVTSWATPEEDVANANAWINFGGLYYEGPPGGVVDESDDETPFY